VSVKAREFINGKFNVVVGTSIPLCNEMDGRYCPRTDCFKAYSAGYAAKYPFFAQILAHYDKLTIILDQPYTRLQQKNS
jgi:hypothetical protein